MQSRVFIDKFVISIMLSLLRIMQNINGHALELLYLYFKTRMTGKGENEGRILRPNLLKLDECHIFAPSYWDS